MTCRDFNIRDFSLGFLTAVGVIAVSSLG